MLKSARISPEILNLHAANLRGVRPKLEDWNNTLTTLKSCPNAIKIISDYSKENLDILPTVPCVVFHPKHENCQTNVLYLAVNAFRNILPMHLSLNTIPALLFKPMVIYKR